MLVKSCWCNSCCLCSGNATETQDAVVYINGYDSTHSGHVTLAVLWSPLCNPINMSIHVMVCLKFWVDCYLLIDTHCWELMKAMGSHHSLHCKCDEDHGLSITVCRISCSFRGILCWLHFCVSVESRTFSVGLNQMNLM